MSPSSSASSSPSASPSVSASPSATARNKVESRDASPVCTTLDPATFTVHGTPLARSMAGGSAGDCYRFAGTAGMRLTVETTATTAVPDFIADLRGTLRNPAGEQVCPIQFGGADCTLDQDGEYEFVLRDEYGNPVDYTLRLIRTDRPIGCDTLEMGGFGPLTPAQIADVKLGAGETTCYTVPATAGAKLVRTSDGGQIGWYLTSPAGQVCQESGYGGFLCDLPADGDYTLWFKRGDWPADTVDFQAVMVDVAGDAGCAPVAGLDWDRSVHTYTPAGPLEVYCQPFDAKPGERVAAFTAGSGRNWIAGAAGTDLCTEYEEYQDGCVLPAGGPYRMIVEAGAAERVKVQIGSLSAPAGCVPVTPGAYGTAPAGALGGNRCRALTVPAAGKYLVRTVDERNYEEYAQVYTADGKRLCSAGYFCDFPAAGTYTLILGGTGKTVDEGRFATVLTAPTAAGCVAVTDQGLSTGAARGSFATAGETDCLELSSPAGATVSVLTTLRASGAARPDAQLINAAGTDACSGYDCVLTGPAPYRVLLTAPEDSSAGDYAVVVQRLDQVTGCPAMPAAGTVTFGADRSTACWTIPAGQHAASEILTFASVTDGAGWAYLSVTDSAGHQVCASGLLSSASLATCKFSTGKAYTVVMRAAAENVQYRVGRRDATGATCQTPGNTVLGGVAATGTLAARDDIRCYRVTAAAADNYWLGVRNTADNSVRYWIIDGSGAERCSGFIVPCRVSGSTSYVVFVRSAVDGPVAYAVDTWNLGTADRPAEQCPAVPAAPGFSLAGTLDDTHTAVCVAVPVSKGRSEFRAVLGSTAAEPYYFSTTGDGGAILRCSWMTGGRGCDVYLPYPAPATSTALFVLARQEVTGTVPFRMDALCDYEPCDGKPYVLTSAAPASAPNSGPVTLTLRGEVAAGDTVRLTRTGATSITAVVQTVANGVLTATADVTGALPGLWNVTASAADGRSTTLAGALTVTATGLRLVKAPAISGTIRVGSTVRAVAGTWSPAASSYSYQWAANGVAIKGAVGSAYAIPASLRGKRLTVTVTAHRANLLTSPAVSAGGWVGWGAAPKATKAPKITGTVKAGRKVKVSVGGWTPRADSYRYEWRVNGKLVGTGSALTIKKSWAGKKLTVTVIARKAGCYDGRKTSGSVRIKR
ncbi:hypothetical protein GCM10010168_43410 [Actinoplanes ianthinogenes]|uniref:Ig-like domain-containing protein n=1 Tax=Actinoplanes ianthinogenes TaxID=122358 RepID=A0ABM7LVW9_9ACTN|nr:hypothetical protein Aiant_40070 [Actinoplanes ianthinogenes]GGR20714.1 hypothetical protein GCM10010168_43410 [Actinoplanes ianthinogenes]